MDLYEQGKYLPSFLHRMSVITKLLVVGLFNKEALYVLKLHYQPNFYRAIEGGRELGAVPQSVFGLGPISNVKVPPLTTASCVM